MKSLNAFIIYIVFLFFSCSTSDNNKSGAFEIMDFEQKIQLKGKIYTYPKILIPTRILYKNDKLIVSDRSGLALLHRIDAMSMEYESEMGQMGWGPGEIPSVGKIQSGLDDESFWVYAGEGKMIVEYDLKNNRTELFKNVIRQSDQWFMASDLVIVDDNSLLGFMINGNDQFKIFDSLGNEKSAIGKWSEVFPELSYNPFLIADLHQGDLIGNPKSKIYVLPGIFVDRIDIINLNDKSLKTIKGPLNYIPPFKISNYGGMESLIVDSSTGIYAYNTGFVGENYIYLAYFGEKNSKQTENLVNDILVLDFDGKPIVHYELDVSILNLSVDEINRKIYGTTYGEEPGIVVFDY